MDVFWSIWRCRTVPCPWGSAAPACETTLLHHEQFKIHEHLARFAVRHGMWGFVRCMADHVPQFVAGRRQRCAPSGQDPAAYGAGCAPNPPEPAGGSSAAADAAAAASEVREVREVRALASPGSSASLVSLGGGGSSAGSAAAPEGSVCCSEDSQGSAGSGRRLARVAAVLLAGGVAMMLKKGGAASGGGHKGLRHPRAHPHHVRRHRRPSTLAVPEQ
jgi:hypothetical protein